MSVSPIETLPILWLICVHHRLPSLHLLVPKAPTKLSLSGAGLGINWWLKKCCPLANWHFCMWNLFPSLALLLLLKDSGKGQFWNDSGINIGDLVQTVNVYLFIEWVPCTDMMQGVKDTWVGKRVRKWALTFGWWKSERYTLCVELFGSICHN